MKQSCKNCQQEIPGDAVEGICPECLALLFTSDGGAAQAELHRAIAEEIESFQSHYRIDEWIGGGGMGLVFRAYDQKLGRTVALKVLRPELGDGDGMAERFAQEARALARLKHENIVAVHESGQAGSLYFLSMEFVEGTDLRTLMDEEKLDPELVLTLIPQICSALQLAHQCGVVHRDIKPENIMLDEDGKARIADFGLAKIIGAQEHERLTQTSVRMGTAQYMAPEQFEETAKVDHRADIYSLGVVFYEMLTGTMPQGAFELPSRSAGVGAYVDDVVLKALKQDREERYQAADDLADDLALKRKGRSQVARVLAAPFRFLAGFPLWVKILLGVVVIASLAITAFFVFLGTRPTDSERWHRYWQAAEKGRVEEFAELAVHDRPWAKALGCDRLDPQGWRPSHIIVNRKKRDLLAWLLKQEIDLDARNPKGQTPLLIAAKKNDFESAAMLLDAGATPYLKTFDQDMNAMHYAALHGDERLVSKLLNLNVNLEGKMKNGNRAVHLAAANGHVSVLQQLADAGAILNPKNSLGNTPMILASSKGHQAVCQFLITKKIHIDHAGQKLRTALAYAAMNGHVGILEDLIAAGANIEHRDEGQATPLMLGAMRGQSSAVRLLLKRGANAAAVDKNGVTLRGYATIAEHYPSDYLAQEAGAKDCALASFIRAWDHSAAQDYAAAEKELGPNLKVFDQVIQFSIQRGESLFAVLEPAELARLLKSESLIGQSRAKEAQDLLGKCPKEGTTVLYRKTTNRETVQGSRSVHYESDYSIKADWAQLHNQLRMYGRSPRPTQLILLSADGRRQTIEKSPGRSGESSTSGAIQIYRVIF